MSVNGDSKNVGSAVVDGSVVPKEKDDAEVVGCAGATVSFFPKENVGAATGFGAAEVVAVGGTVFGSGFLVSFGGAGGFDTGGLGCGCGLNAG